MTEPMEFIFGDGDRVEWIELELELPDEFPDKYRRAVAHAAGHCTVRQRLEHPPKIEVRLVARQVA